MECADGVKLLAELEVSDGVTAFFSLDADSANVDKKKCKTGNRTKSKVYNGIFRTLLIRVFASPVSDSADVRMNACPPYPYRTYLTALLRQVLDDGMAYPSNDTVKYVEYRILIVTPFYPKLFALSRVFQGKSPNELLFIISDVDWSATAHTEISVRLPDIYEINSRGGAGEVCFHEVRQLLNRFLKETIDLHAFKVECIDAVSAGQMQQATKTTTRPAGPNAHTKNLDFSFDPARNKP